MICEKKEVPELAAKAFEKLVRTMKALRTPGTGCPWDLEQDHRSIRPYLLEEAHEVLEAIDGGNDAELRDELGDLLLQVALHSQIAWDRGAFSIDEVVTAIDTKMIRRHPHVFGEVAVENSAEVLRNWEQIKIKEEQNKPSASGKTLSDKLSGIPKALPALVRAQRIGEKASRFKFDWRDLKGVIAKVEEEIAELKAELVGIELNSSEPLKLAGERKNRIESELGDVYFSLTQLSRWLGVHSEDALRETCARFLDRVNKMETLLGKEITEHSDQEIDSAWEAAKKL